MSANFGAKGYTPLQLLSNSSLMKEIAIKLRMIQKLSQQDENYSINLARFLKKKFNVSTRATRLIKLEGESRNFLVRKNREGIRITSSSPITELTIESLLRCGIKKKTLNNKKYERNNA